MSLSFALELDEERRTIRDAVEAYCRDCADDLLDDAGSPVFDRQHWVGLAELGVLGLATPEGGGGALEWVAAAEALGRAVFPGPLVETVLAVQLLDSGARAPLISGEKVAAVGTSAQTNAGAPPLLAFAAVADAFVVLDPDAGTAWLGHPIGEVEPVDTLGGEPWGRVSLERVGELGDARRGLGLARVVSAAYLAGAGRRLIDDATEHARTRRQFGRAIGEFQAVAHPLASCAIQLSAAEGLARVAALHLDECHPDGDALAAAARGSARRASLDAAATAHQTFGAVGVTVAGPAFFASRRIRQLASWPLGDDAAGATILDRFAVPSSAVETRPGATH